MKGVIGPRSLTTAYQHYRYVPKDRMLIREGLFYVCGAWAVTLTAGMGVTYFLYQSMNYRGVAFSIPLMPILLAVLVSFLTGVSVPVFTWMVLEKSGTVVERIRGII